MQDPKYDPKNMSRPIATPASVVDVSMGGRIVAAGYQTARKGAGPTATEWMDASVKHSVPLQQALRD